MAPNRGFALIGPLPFNDRPLTLGGATRLFEVMVEDARKQNRDFSLVVANPHDRGGLSGKIKNLRHVLSELEGSARRHKVWVVNASQGGIQVLFPLLWVYAGLRGKKVVLRAFGAHLLDSIRASKMPPLLFRALRSLPLVYVESKALVEQVRAYNPRVEWFPNVRSVPTLQPDWTRPYARRFAYIGQVRESKGLPELIRVFDRLGPEFQLEVYGPIAEDGMRWIERDARYHGPLDAEGVQGVLANIDVLVLPTRYEGEGYPGIILEAYAHGVPCVSTLWKHVPEIVDHDRSGWLLEPGDEQALFDRIQTLDAPTLERCRPLALAKAAEFDSEAVHRRIFDQLESLTT